MAKMKIKQTPGRNVVKTPEVKAQNLEENVRIRAYELYEQRNGAAGDPEGDWYRAEAEIRANAPRAK